MRVTWSEIKAAALMAEGPLTNEPIDYHEEANKIIALAEQIKAERAVAAMEEK